MDPKHKRCDAIQICQREAGQVLPLSEKVKVLHVIRKEKKSYADVAKLCGKNESSICEIMKKKKMVLVLL